MLDVSECAGRVRVCWTCQGVGGFWMRMDILRACQGVGGFGVHMNMSMGVPGHSELVGARDGYRSMKLFVQNKSRTIHLAHPVKH